MVILPIPLEGLFANRHPSHQDHHLRPAQLGHPPTDRQASEGDEEGEARRGAADADIRARPKEGEGRGSNEAHGLEEMMWGEQNCEQEPRRLKEMVRGAGRNLEREQLPCSLDDSLFVAHIQARLGRWDTCT